MKNTKKAHTSSSPKGMGDYYGSGVKNPVGRTANFKKTKKVLDKIASKKINFA